MNYDDFDYDADECVDDVYDEYHTVDPADLADLVPGSCYEEEEY